MAASLARILMESDGNFLRGIKTIGFAKIQHYKKLGYIFTMPKRNNAI
jgi:hypothetical protein